jgi:zinc protease
MLKRSLVLLLAASTLACAQAKYKPKGKPVEYDGHFATFPSGLRLVVYEMPRVDRFAVTVSYGSGSAQDPAGKEGLAHLVEHLAFRAAPGGDGVRLWDELLASGLQFNASTSHDATNFTLSGKPADLARALATEAARMRDPIAHVSDDEFAIERDVVVSEYRERFETDPDGAQVAWLLEAAFEGHPYARPVGGNPESLRRIALADARAWAKARYVPSNAIVVVVSPSPAREVVQRAFELFGDLASGTKAPLPEGPAPSFTAGAPEEELPLLTKSAPVAQPVLWVAWPVPGEAGRRTPLGHAAASAMSAAIWPLVWQSFREGSFEAVDDAGVALFTLHSAGLMVARVELRKASDAKRMLEVVKSAAFAIGRDRTMQSNVMTVRHRAEIVKRTRDRLLVDGYLAIEDIDGARVAAFLRATGQADYLAGWQKDIALQLKYDVDQYANDHLRREHAVAVLVTPDGAALARNVVARAPRGEQVDAAAEALLPPPGPAAALAAARAPGLDRVERRTLENGLEVVVAQRGTLPIAEVRVLVRTNPQGSPAIPAGLPNVALASNHARFASNEVSLVGGSAEERLGAESLVRGERGASSNLDVLLQSAAGWAKDQKLRWFDEGKRYTVGQYASKDADPYRRANEAFVQGLFPGHPYAAVPRTDMLRDVSRWSAAAWMSGEIRPERATVILVSDQEPTPELWDAIAGAFGGWGRGSVERVPAPVPPMPTARRIVLIDRPGASQAVIQVGFRAPPLVERDAVAHEALGWLVEHGLEQRLRLEEGVSYGAYVDELEHARSGALVVATAVDRDAAGEALTAVLAAPRALANQAPFAAETARARWQVARRFGYRFDTVRASADALEELAKHGLPPDRFEKLPADIATLDPARIQKAAAALGLGRESVVVLADAATVGPQLQAAGFTVEVAR